MPTVDVVVPCYNYGRYLPDCVASVLGQEGCDVRVLIVDDASPDGSADVARRMAAADPRVTLIAHAANRGHIATYNEGIAWSSGDYFLLLSADDLLAPGALDRAVSVMQADRAIAWTYGREAELYEGNPPPTETAPPPGPAAEGWRVAPGADFIAATCRTGWNNVATCTAVVRGEAQRRAGFYRPTLPHAGDLEMWLRLSTFGSVATTDAVQGVRRLHPHNMAKEHDGPRDLRQRVAAFESFFEQDGRALPMAAPWLAAARRGLAVQAGRWALSYLRRGSLGKAAGCARFAIGLNPRAAASAPLAWLEERHARMWR